LNRLVQEVDPLSGQTDYGYNGQDELTDVADPIGLTTVYVRDGFGGSSRRTAPIAASRSMGTTRPVIWSRRPMPAAS
jgi:YD repeat-containing protein